MHGSLSFKAARRNSLSELGQSLLKRDVRVTSVYPSISDMTWRRCERRKGPEPHMPS